MCAVCAVALAGCAVGPDYRRPPLPLGETFRETPAQTASIADTPWFDVFTDPVLRQLVEEALANNRDLRAAIARVEQARDEAAIARSPLFPQVGYGGVAARGKLVRIGVADQEAPEVANTFLAFANASWELDLWGRIRRGAEASYADLLASDAGRHGVVLSLVSQVAQSYFELLELDLELQIARDNVVSFQETFDLFNRRYRGGVASKLDSLRAQAALAQVAADVPRVEAAIVQKENEIAVLVGRPAQGMPRGTALLAQSVPPEIPAGVPAQLLERRPDLIQSEQTLVAANATIGETFAQYFPRVGLTALGGTLSSDVSNLLEHKSSLWSYAAQAAGPLFTAGQTTYQWKAAQAATDAALASYESAVLNALREVSDALIARSKLDEQRAQRETSVAALEEALKTARTRYAGGLATYLEVLDAQQQLYPEQLALAQVRRDELVSVVTLYRVLGGGWNAAEPAPAVPSNLRP
ncbi:MAG TPA: efflux transporter outer membrane subunit [Myxococcota bacterium]|nr:efflux transporter outer membrane subunit [Myxococcota bacterium]